MQISISDSDSLIAIQGLYGSWATRDRVASWKAWNNGGTRWAKFKISIFHSRNFTAVPEEKSKAVKNHGTGSGRRQRTEQDLRSLIGHTASEAVLGGVDVMTGQEYISTSMSDAKAPSWNSKSIPQ